MVPQSTDFRCERTRRNQYAPPRRGIKIDINVRISDPIIIKFPCLAGRFLSTEVETAPSLVTAVYIKAPRDQQFVMVGSGNELVETGSIADRHELSRLIWCLGGGRFVLLFVAVTT